MRTAAPIARDLLLEVQKRDPAASAIYTGNPDAGVEGTGPA